LRILLAEDNSVNQLYAASLLQQSGHYVRVTATGREALAAFERESFDIALMDIEMPEMDGFATTAAIRQREKTTGRRMPIVALTAHAVKGFREQCLTAGMDGYLAKPVRAQDLLDAVQRSADLASSQRGARNGDYPKFPAESVRSEFRTANSGLQIPFDRAAALARVEGNAEILTMLMGSYFQEVPGVLANLRQAVEQRQTVPLRQAAHTLIGMLSVFSAIPAQDAATRLKEASADFPRAATLLTELERELALLNDALKREADAPLLN
jgi:CheY-like chemotaxis protein/HPt (histidine-containing phosphotransfer) domain-containing protein